MGLPNAWGQTNTNANVRPNGSLIMQKVMESAEQAATNKNRSGFVFKMTTVVEDFNPDGTVKARKERTYDVRVINGITEMKLKAIQGENLTQTALKKEAENDSKIRQKLVQTKSGSGDKREDFLNPDILIKYRYRVVGEETVSNRPCYKLTFEPKFGELKVKSAPDLLLNRLSGEIWVDIEEFQIAKAAVHLREEFNLWGGLLVTIKKLNFTLTRIRVEKDVWFNQTFTSLIEGHKLMIPMRIRGSSTSTDFQKSDPPKE